LHCFAGHFLKTSGKKLSQPAKHKRDRIGWAGKSAIILGFEEEQQEKTYCPQKDCQDESAAGELFSSKNRARANLLREWRESVFLRDPPTQTCEGWSTVICSGI
jgi:hypothetical protein